ncbi:MAG: FMN-binding negative transcriptional regulator, partial [Betaproteobacteria bacterium]|nr:FMN-binding negative transcriptional regulator [Betaproteobacteria bacterium]
MYTPNAFLETDDARIDALVRAHDFATLISVRDGAPAITH